MVRRVGQTGLVDIVLGDPGARMLPRSKQKGLTNAKSLNM